MEFHEKLQQLRKQKDLTQEEAAELLFVSRTAISKWESGRGYPNIESLKAIAKLYAVSVDDLFSGEELISLAETEQKEKADGMRNLVFGFLDVMAALLFFLPLFGQQENGGVVTVPLISFTDTADYIWLIFPGLIALTVVFGIVQFALQNWRSPGWLKSKWAISLVLSLAILMFSIMSRHPYPGSLVLCLLVIKGFFLLKRS